MGIGISADRTAVLAVDLQGENCTGSAWQVQDYEAVLANAAKTMNAARAAGIPVIYSRHALDPDGHDALRHEARDADGRPLASRSDRPEVEICDQVRPRPGDIVFDKQRFSAFYGTKLDLLLRQVDAEHLIVLGCWTEACLETTVWDAIWRDFRITLVRDACGSFNRFAHQVAMLDMANWLYGGQIGDADEVVKGLRGEPFRAWRFREPHSLHYTADTVERLYGQLGG